MVSRDPYSLYDTRRMEAMGRGDSLDHLMVAAGGSFLSVGGEAGVDGHGPDDGAAGAGEPREAVGLAELSNRAIVRAALGHGLQSAELGFDEAGRGVGPSVSSVQESRCQRVPR